MQNSILTQFLLPALLAFLMFGLGLKLTLKEFARLLQNPLPIVIGTFGQILLLPFIALLLCQLFELQPELAIGMMILAACPGGAMSNVISHVGNANLALSVTLTAISTLICIFTTPIIIDFSISIFNNEIHKDFHLDSTILGLMTITLAPIAIGMTFKHYRPALADRWESFFKRFSVVFMLILIVAISIQEREILKNAFENMFLITVTLNFIAILCGFLLGLLFFLKFKDNVTLGIEIGIQNASMAMIIAISFMQRPDLAIPAGVYGVTMYLGVIVLLISVKLLKRRFQSEF